ncbi:sigma-E factor negative regulatory protein [Billgrantia tianxiuensis]|uniref:sigma-E factor negative regulatory protein n=1 Tax=Billgrantia tianxiuensis TaxID=2497861 RepID=UPI001F26791D|nr:sigma-E factor negative regulatory protein [Halomonas tianxiuensis]
MSQNARESLSALMDNEGDDLELRRVLKTLESEPDAAEAWRRYHLMRSLLRRDHDIDVSTDLSAGIMARLDAEPAPAIEEPRLAPRRSSYSLSRSAGIAAAVTLMVITGVQFYQGSDFTSTGGDAQLADGEARSSSAQPQRSLAAQAGGGSQAVPVGMPLFSPASSGAQSGLMPVGAGLDSPLFMTPNPVNRSATTRSRRACCSPISTGMPKGPPTVVAMSGCLCYGLRVTRHWGSADGGQAYRKAPGLPQQRRAAVPSLFRHCRNAG